MFLLLSVFFFPPSVYRIEIMLNEVGFVSVVGSRSNSTAPTADNVFNLTLGDGSNPSIKNNIHVPSPHMRMTIGGCGIEQGQIYHLYFVTMDDEDPPNTMSTPSHRLVYF